MIAIFSVSKQMGISCLSTSLKNVVLEVLVSCSLVACLPAKTWKCSPPRSSTMGFQDWHRTGMVEQLRFLHSCRRIIRIYSSSFFHASRQKHFIFYSIFFTASVSQLELALQMLLNKTSWNGSTFANLCSRSCLFSTAQQSRELKGTLLSMSLIVYKTLYMGFVS
jgi:hypothetical protein